MVKTRPDGLQKVYMSGVMAAVSLSVGRPAVTVAMREGGLRKEGSMNAKPHILVVEDEIAIRSGLVDVFTSHGFATEQAGEGPEGRFPDLPAAS